MIAQTVVKYNVCYFFRNFYEMVRFDFLLDDNLNVYLIEVSKLVYKL